MKIPNAPRSIQKGVPLKNVLGEQAVYQLASNIKEVYEVFDGRAFCNHVIAKLDQLELMGRSKYIAKALFRFLPDPYSVAIDVLMQTLTAPLTRTYDNGLAPMFYLPYCDFVAMYGVDAVYNAGVEPFYVSLQAQYELTQRSTCEFSIRAFLERDTDRTLAVLNDWCQDSNPHVRRLCSEGTRPRLPWAQKLNVFIENPHLVLPILEALKDDTDLYVRRSVANHVGDIAKDHLNLALDICENWLESSSKELKWVIRHALRNPAKKENKRALYLRTLAK
ncbi:MAG: DNA alkylation repair protein [Flavicella sp.]